jgi:hypothetical protein
MMIAILSIRVVLLKQLAIPIVAGHAAERGS